MANIQPALLHSDADDTSLAADSWSFQSEYGSVLDTDDPRHAEGITHAGFETPDSSGDEEEEDTTQKSILGLRSHWDTTYEVELRNFNEQGDEGEIWFGEEVMNTVAAWTKWICSIVSMGPLPDRLDGMLLLSQEDSEAQAMADLSSWNVLDVGTGNGVFLHSLAKQGFTNLTGVDYSEGAIELAKTVAMSNGYYDLNFMVDDILETKLLMQFKLVTDKGTLDAIGLHPDGAQKRVLYWKTVSKLVTPGGVLIITSCNNTKNELVAEARCNMRNAAGEFVYLQPENLDCSALDARPVFRYVEHVRTYPIYRFGGIEGTRVSTVAFLRIQDGEC